MWFEEHLRWVLNFWKHLKTEMILTSRHFVVQFLDLGHFAFLPNSLGFTRTQSMNFTNDTHRHSNFVLFQVSLRIGRLSRVIFVDLAKIVFDIFRFLPYYKKIRKRKAFYWLLKHTCSFFMRVINRIYNQIVHQWRTKQSTGLERYIRAMFVFPLKANVEQNKTRMNMSL